MKTLFLLLSLSAWAANDVRTLSVSEGQALGEKLGKALRHCKQLKKGAAVEISLQNATDESIDKNPIVAAIEASLHTSSTDPGKKYSVRAKLASKKLEKGKDYQAVYTLSAAVMQAEEKLCDAKEEFRKSGEIPGK